MDPITAIAIGKGLAEIAPQLVKWMTGSSKAEAIAEKAIDIAQVVTGHRTPEEALKALQHDAALAIEYQQAVLAQETEFRRLQLAETQAMLADVADARKRDSGITSAGRHNYRGDILAMLAVGALCLCVWLVATNPDLPAGAREAIMFVAGVFASAVRDVYGFEFGSSRGSQAKDATIDKLAGKP